MTLVCDKEKPVNFDVAFVTVIPEMYNEKPSRSVIIQRHCSYLIHVDLHRNVHDVDIQLIPYLVGLRHMHRGMQTKES